MNFTFTFTRIVTRRLFCVMAGSAAFAAIPICRELRYTIFSSMVTVSINLLVILQEDAGNVFLQQADI
jgi:hypothetical protein